MRRYLTAIFVLGSLGLNSSAGDELLQKAFEAANAGRSQEAIDILEQLRVASPADGRVLLRLGLLYQSERRYSQAISTLEQAVAIEHTPEALYGLGLLYEEQMLSATDSAQRSELGRKALQSWSGLLNLIPDGDFRARRAHHHIKRLSEGQ